MASWCATVHNSILVNITKRNVVVQCKFEDFELLWKFGYFRCSYLGGCSVLGDLELKETKSSKGVGLGGVRLRVTSRGQAIVDLGVTVAIRS